MNPDSVFASDDEIIVTGVYPRWCLWLSVGYFLFGLALAAPAYFDAQMMSSQSGKITIISVILLFFWLPSLFLVWATIRTRVIADKIGLRWRGVFGWKSATWMQVRDYYIQVASDKLPPSNACFIVETTQGKFDLKDMTRAALLREIVRQRALNANAKDWELRVKKTTLELSAPETFIVHENPMRELWIMFFVAVVLMVAIMLLGASPKWNTPFAAFYAIRETWQTLGPLWALEMILRLSFPSLLYVLLIFISWPKAREAQQRRGQTITVSEDGLIWRDPKTQREVEARWDEVRDFYVDELQGTIKTNARYVIETAQGNFDFVAMKNDERLRALIRKFCADHGLQREWDTKRQRRQQSTPTAGGARLYTYRQSEMRAMVWFVVAIMIGMWILVPMRILGWTPNAKAGDPGEWALVAFFFSFVNIGGIWFLWNYFCFQILTDENGITQRCGRRTKFIAWPDVREYETSASCIVVRSEQETIRFLNIIGAQKELEETIKTHATCSLTKSW